MASSVDAELQDATERVRALRAENTLLATRQGALIRRISENQASHMEEANQLMESIRWRDELLDSYSNRLFLLDGAVANLKDWLAEAESERDQLQTRIDDLDDPPIKEPQQ